MTDASLTIAQLGDAFAAMLRADLTPGAMATIMQRNATPAYASACASHDFCDANMTMLAAFEELIGREPRFLSGTDERGNHTAEQEADMALWNAAWTYAKARHLTAV